MNKKTKGSLMLLLAALIWGNGFVAQSVAMDSIGPWTFTFIRNLIAGLVLLPIIRVEDSMRKKNGDMPSWNQKDLIRGGVLCGIILAAASMFQQIGILHTSVGKAGFLTAMYCVMVPVFGIFLGKKTRPAIWFCVAMAAVGLYFLCMTEASFTLQSGDILELCCALGFTFHILVIDFYSPKVDGIRLSCIQFFVASAVCLAGTLLFEHLNLHDLLRAAVPILYAGVLSSGGGYTLQIIGQKDADPAVASILLCLESVFAVLGGWVILHQSLTGREILGCVLMFIAIVIASLPEKKPASEKN